MVQEIKQRTGVRRSAAARERRTRPKRLLGTSGQSIFPHQARYAVLPALQAPLAQLPGHAGTAVTAFVGLKDLPDLLDQFGILLLAPARLRPAPSIIPTARNPQRFATFLNVKIHR